MPVVRWLYRKVMCRLPPSILYSHLLRPLFYSCDQPLTACEIWVLVFGGAADEGSSVNTMRGRFPSYDTAVYRLSFIIVFSSCFLGSVNTQCSKCFPVLFAAPTGGWWGLASCRLPNSKVIAQPTEWLRFSTLFAFLSTSFHNPHRTKTNS